MADIYRVDHLMRGIEVSDWEEQADQRSQRSRSLSIPIGMRTLWAAFDEETLDAKFLLHERVMTVEAKELWSRRYGTRGTVMTTTHTLATRFSDHGEPCAELDLARTEGKAVTILSEQAMPAVSDIEEIENTFSFDTDGWVISPFGYRPSHKVYATKFHEYMDMLESFREATSELPK